MRKFRSESPEYREKDRRYRSEIRKTPEGKFDNKYRASIRKSKVDCSGNRELIKQIYRSCPEGYHVDHIRPISKGGLHHEDNLQYLPKQINLEKSAKLDFDCKGTEIAWKDILFQTLND